MSTPVRALVVWLGIIAAETVHGVLREALLAPRVGGFRARQIAVFTGMAIILAVVTLTRRFLRLPDDRARLRVGLAWVVLTVAFEVALGRLVIGASWARIAEDYDLRHGGLMGLGLVVLALSPAIAARLRAAPPVNRRS
jgi:hypothetical protein